MASSSDLYRNNFKLPKKPVIDESVGFILRHIFIALGAFEAFPMIVVVIYQLEIIQKKNFLIKTLIKKS